MDRSKAPTGETICPECVGTGQIEGAPCAACGGTGKASEGQLETGSTRREKHHGVGGGGLKPSDDAKPTLVKGHQGLGSEGEKR